MTEKRRYQTRLRQRGYRGVEQRAEETYTPPWPRRNRVITGPIVKEVMILIVSGDPCE